MSRIEEFENDDDRYRRWIDSHPAGYVLNLRRSGGYMLHGSECQYLWGSQSEYTKQPTPFSMTKKRRLWAPTQDELEERCKHETGKDAEMCLPCLRAKRLEPLP